MNLFWSWLVPSVVGFLFGYLTCSLVTRATSASASGDSTRLQVARAIFGVLLILMSTATFVQSYRSIACIRDGIIERSDATGRQTTAQIVLLEAQLDDVPGNDRQAIEDYIEAVRELERIRADNPLRCT